MSFGRKLLTVVAVLATVVATIWTVLSFLGSLLFDSIKKKKDQPQKELDSTSPPPSTGES